MTKQNAIFDFIDTTYKPFINSIEEKKSTSKIYEKHIQMLWNKHCKNKTFTSLDNQQIKNNQHRRLESRSRSRLSKRHHFD